MENRGSHLSGVGGGVGGQAPVTLPVQPVQEDFASRPREGAWRFTAPALDCSVPQLRCAVRDLVRRQGGVPEDTLQNQLLVLSELVTNAVKHAALLSPEIAVEVAIGAEWIRVSVEDNHPYRPKALVTDYGQTGGRGLLLVREITLEAGGSCDVEHTASGGKIIWAALPLRPTGGTTPL
jgi:signal transduction histidine kinase